MNKVKHLVAALACVGAAGVCSADTVRVGFANPIFGSLGSDSVQIEFANPGPGGGISTHNVAAGRFQGTGSDLVGQPASIFPDGLENLYLYCYDVYQSINHGQSLVYTINFNGEFARTLDFLGAVNSVMNGSKSLGDAGYDPYAWLHPVDGSQGAAIQLGIWESKYETDAAWDFTGGTFKASGLDGTTGNWWNSFNGRISDTAAVGAEFVMTLDNPNFQDMITGDPPAPVPEPGSLALLVVALAALAYAYTQRKKLAPI